MHSGRADRPFRSVEVRLSETDGSFEKMLRRFIRRVKDDGILAEVYQRRHFRKPSQLRRVAKIASR